MTRAAIIQGDAGPAPQAGADLAPVTEFSDFHREEFIALRRDISDYCTALDRIIYLTAAAAFAVASWLQLQGPDLPPWFAAAPLMVAIIGCWLFYGKVGVIQAFGSYVRKLEERFADPLVKGWEHHISPLATGNAFNVMNAFYWLSLFGATSAFLVWKLVAAVSGNSSP